ncbi:hypothetical protein NW752_006899 [Fusarium irregulare]|uniref:Uncharacterized protein n=1 Tax=Fusarium irregulare TaxID=2494466 RepID=A0A9W8UBS9_9HYPO|nr:hypothetical protein NW766_005778 [Fusarium irregulare]KAJ4015966.1 hypothetical protein NW752_006899 [Fusarium irregulare]
MSSPAPLPTEIREALKTFLQDDLKHAEGDAESLFGHIAMPPCRLLGIPQAIYDLLPVDRSDTRVIFVNFDERVAAVDNDLPVENFSFADFLVILRKNIRPKKGPFPWWEPVDIDDWRERILPSKAVIAMQLDTQISAQCALALTCLVEWACADFPVERDIRVVTMSPPVDQDLLLDLVSQKEVDPSVSVCDIQALWTRAPTKDCQIHVARSFEQMYESLQDVVNEPSTNARLVLSFDEDIDNYISSPSGDEEDETFERFHVSASDPPLNIFQLAQKAKPGKTIVATIFGHFDHLPLTWDSFQEVHLVVGHVDTTTPAWDNKSQQVLAPHWTSRQDRMSQLWWADQPAGVAVTVYSAKYTPEDFVKNGASHIRLVQGAHLGGYIVAAIDLMSYGVGSNETIALFVQNPSAVECIKIRLTRQTLISSNRLNLGSTEAKLFRDALPSFNYDYRVAMLFALDCNPAVRRFKAQFIALLISGAGCRFENTEITLQDINDMFSAARGYGSSLVRYGTTWVTLGLVKLLFAVMTGSGNTYDLRCVAFHAPSVEVVRNTYYRLLDVFQEHELNPDYLPFETSEHGLSKDDRLRFHTDLFLAYMDQVVLCHRPTERDDGNYDPEFTSLTSMQPCEFSLGTNVLSLLFNPRRVAREMGHDGWYGISHKLSRSYGSLTFDDWVVIPAEVIALWSEETGLTPSDLASTVVHQTSNSNEVTDESFDLL